MDDLTTVYEIVNEDLQVVAREKLNRELTQPEIDLISKGIHEAIDWHAIISDTITATGIE